MANQVTYQETPIAVGDTIKVSYKIKEADNKERLQDFEGILLKIKGSSDATRMITVRKIANDGTGVGRIIPLMSPFIASIKLVKESNYQKSKLYFIRTLSDQKLRNKLYSKKIVAEKRILKAKTASKKK